MHTRKNSAQKALHVNGIKQRNPSSIDDEDRARNTWEGEEAEGEEAKGDERAETSMKLASSF